MWPTWCLYILLHICIFKAWPHKWKNVHGKSFVVKYASTVAMAASWQLFQLNLAVALKVVEEILMLSSCLHCRT